MANDPSQAPLRDPGAPRGLFVTGTDTGVGKTVASCALLRALADRGLRAIGMKPVASGCTPTPDGLRNDDALALLRAGEQASYDLVNPFAYEPAIAPHLAARAVQRPISLEHVAACHRELRALADVVVVEGAGGWRVPLDDDLTLAELPKRLGLGVVLVVGLRLGCLNHTLLTAEAIHGDGLELRGWIVNCIEPPDANDAPQIETLRRRLRAPLLGVLPHRPGVSPEALAPEALAQHLDVRPLLDPG
ncbi:MAG: dethiobiotin synthase [Myxococcales bacterium]|nr:dethiobiotin synthase [Myxococcales bacterium]